MSGWGAASPGDDRLAWNVFDSQGRWLKPRDDARALPRHGDGGGSCRESGATSRMSNRYRITGWSVIGSPSDS